MAAADDLRVLLRRVPAPVAVVSVEVEGERLGLTIGSFVSLSLEPPLVGFAISRQAALHELLRRADELAVSVLAEGQSDLAAHFARGVPPIALWERVVLHGEGPPQLEGAVGWLRCRVDAAHDAGDHTFFVAEVLAVEEGVPGRALTYHQQAYE